MAGPSNSSPSYRFVDPRGQDTRRTFFLTFTFVFGISLPLALLSTVSLLHTFVSTMDEIAPEYDVVVLGTGESFLPRHSSATMIDLVPPRLDRVRAVWVSIAPQVQRQMIIVAEC